MTAYKGYQIIEDEEPATGLSLVDRWLEVKLGDTRVAWAGDLEAARWEIDTCEKLGTHLGARVRLRDGTNTGVIHAQHHTLDIHWDEPNEHGVHMFTVLYCDIDDDPEKELRKAQRILSHMTILDTKEVRA